MKKYFCNKTNKNNVKTRDKPQKTTFLDGNEFPVPQMRLETMILMGMEIPLAAIQRKIASGVDIIVHLSRYQDKKRRVSDIVEVLDVEEDEIRVNRLYEFVESGTEKGKVCGKLVKRNEMVHTEKLLGAGY